MRYSILINTCDKFEDCWDPFFKLFSKFWPEYNGTIYLNTETKDYSYPDLNIIAIKNGQVFWSDCVKVALEKIQTEYILYLQEDYFLKNYVKSSKLDHYFALMKDNNIDCLHLTDQHSEGPFLPSNIEDFVIINKKAKNRISCQAAIWKKDILLSYLLKGESGWNFETYGTIRSRYIKHKFCAIDHNIVKLNKYEIIPYIFTGIVKGKWWPEVENLFASNNINIDLTIRGFYEQPPKIKFKKRLIEKIKRFPKDLKTKWQIVNIIIKY